MCRQNRRHLEDHRADQRADHDRRADERHVGDIGRTVGDTQHLSGGGNILCAADKGEQVAAIGLGTRQDRDIGGSGDEQAYVDPVYGRGSERLQDLVRAVAGSFKFEIGHEYQPAMTTTDVVRAAREATSEIPIVMANSGDPVGTGLIASLARPGGNITGLSLLLPELGGKRLALLQEAVPKVSHVAVLWNPTNAAKPLEWKSTQVAAGALGVRVTSFEVREPTDFASAFAAIVKARSNALIPLAEPLTRAHRRQIAEFAAKNRLPMIAELRDFAEAGGLMSYGPNLPGLYRRAATYVDKILKGAKPADLPVEQPTEFELVINLKTAKALGLTIPQSVLIRADQVIR